MKFPKVVKRRPYDEETFGPDILESDRDFVDNNLDACVWFLENRDKIQRKLLDKMD